MGVGGGNTLAEFNCVIDNKCINTHHFYYQASFCAKENSQKLCNYFCSFSGQKVGKILKIAQNSFHPFVSPEPN